MEKSTITAENYANTFINPMEAQIEDPDSCKYPRQISNYIGLPTNKKKDWLVTVKLQEREWGNGR